MHDAEEITVLDYEDCDILYDALKTYICHLQLIKASCRKQVYMDGIPIEEKIVHAMNLQRSVGARSMKGKKKNENQT